MELRVPATSANLGPGFDSLGLALALYNRFSIKQFKFAERVLRILNCVLIMCLLKYLMRN